MNEAGYYPPEITDPEACTGCQNCMIYCPDFAIAVEKDEKSSPSTKKQKG
jgi:2-oxoglutarate ferredoxin oxidoreductase subunit delta